MQECIKFSKSKSCKMDGLEVKMVQLMKHLKIVNDKALSPLASKVCLCVCVCVSVFMCVV